VLGTERLCRLVPAGCPSGRRAVEVPRGRQFKLTELRGKAGPGTSWPHLGVAPEAPRVQFGDVMYGVPEPGDHEMSDGRKVKLATALLDGERVFQYLYDYGDGWCCTVVLEAVAPTVTGVNYPRLVEGARRGPPEDVGGPWGYGEFLDAIADPKHERHTELLEWFGGKFDPQQFDIDAINRRLASLAPRKTTRRKTAKPAAG
jgi:hypothetical protein